MALFVGCMSGTSLDGVDAVLAQFDSNRPARVIGHAWQPYPDALRVELLALNARGEDELHRASLAANAVARAYAAVIEQLLQETCTQRQALAAIGAHGQTVRHRPQAFDGSGYTVQLLNGALLAELTGADVVCDFRSRDVAAGGFSPRRVWRGGRPCGGAQRRRDRQPDASVTQWRSTRARHRTR
jgi:anhydro-N-acetylmuramic acid kinase